MESQAYPQPPKKEKKGKDKGSRHPGSSGVPTPGAAGEVGSQANAVALEALPDGSVQGGGQEKVSVGKGLQDAMRGLDIKESPLKGDKEAD